jgi:hypothetical protein
MALLRARWKHCTDLWHPDSSAHSSTAADRCIPAFHALVREGGSLAPIARQVRVRKGLTQEQHFGNETTLFRSSTSVVNHPEENTVGIYTVGIPRRENHTVGSVVVGWEAAPDAEVRALQRRN